MVVRSSSGWQVPDGLVGDARLLRVHATAAREGDLDCPAKVAIKARPALQLRTRPPPKPATFEDFTLGPVMEILDLVEHGQFTAEGALRQRQHDDRAKPVNSGHWRWIEHAVATYLELTDRLALVPTTAGGAGVALLAPATEEWVYQWKGSDRSVYEVCAWGRRYADGSGLVRELRLPVFDTVEGRSRDIGEVAVAAMVLANCSAAKRSKWGEPFSLRPSVPVRQVRVIEVGCTDGSHRVLFDGTPQQADELYAASGKHRLRAAVDGGAFRPGGGCVDCRLLSTCPALPRRAGLLGIDDASRPRRTWSVTNGRYYAACPARDAMWRLHLPRRLDVALTAETVRGYAVHEFLGGLHQRLPAAPCVLSDPPVNLERWSAGRWTVEGEQARMGAEMIAQHVSVCALQHTDADCAVQVEPRLVVHDESADVVIIATPDVLYRDGGSWVWRETKTRGWRGPVGSADLLRRYPQVALGVVLLSEGVVGDGGVGWRVELERLTPDAPDISLFGPEHVEEARAVVHDLAVGWHGDLRLEARPDERECGRCDYSGWCPAAVVVTSAEESR